MGAFQLMVITRAQGGGLSVDGDNTSSGWGPFS